MATTNTLNETVVKPDSWYDEYLTPKESKGYPPAFDMKLAEGRKTRTEEIEFTGNGTTLEKSKFGKCIVFPIIWNGEAKSWYIKATQYSLLNVIAPIRKSTGLIGKRATVERSGKEKETRWNIIFK